MKETEHLLDELLRKAEAYGYSSLELAKLKSAKTTANASGKIGAQILLLAIAMLGFLMVTLTVAFWLGEIWGSYYLGFGAVAGFYVLLVLIFGIFKEQLIERPIASFVAKMMLD